MCEALFIQPCKAHVPYYFVFCGLSGRTIFLFTPYILRGEESFLRGSIQSIPPHSSSWRSILMSSSHLCLGLPSGLFPSGFPTKTLYKYLLSPTRYMPRPSQYSRFYHLNIIGWGVQIITLTAGCWLKFCVQLAKVICPYNYCNLFYRRSYRQVQWSTPSTPQALPPYSK